MLNQSPLIQTHFFVFMLLGALLQGDSWFCSIQRKLRFNSGFGDRQKKIPCPYKGITIILITIHCPELTPVNVLILFESKPRQEQSTIKDVINSKQNCISYNHTPFRPAPMRLYTHVFSVNSQRSKQGVFES